MNIDLSLMAVRLLEQRPFKQPEKGLEGYISAGSLGILEESDRQGWWVHFYESSMTVSRGSKEQISLLLKPSQFTPVRPFSLIAPKLDWYEMGRDHCYEDVAIYVKEPYQSTPTTEKRFCAACNGTFFNTICPKDGSPTLALRQSDNAPSIIEAYDLESELGTLEVVEIIATGYSTDVFKAVRRSDQKEFALKMLQERFASKENWLSGFKKEAVVLSELSHPSIVKLYATGTLNQRPYHVLEFVDGGTVAQAVAMKDAHKHKQLSAWFIPICDALGYMATKGILHEDLKSSDIMIATLENTGKIIDLGKSRPIGHLHGTTSINGAFSGNVNYTAPERCLGGSQLTFKANVYSLGCIFYEFIAGVTPFSGGTIAQVAMKHLHAQAEDLRVSHPEIKPELNDLIMSMLSKNPSDRPDYERIKSVLKERTMS